MTISIDRSVYATAPRISLSAGIGLLEQLIAASAHGSPAVQASAANLKKRLRNARKVHQEAAQAVTKPRGSGDLELDHRADRLLAAIKMHLDAWALVEEAAESQRASDLLVLLFPNGMAFTKAPFAEQDVEMQRMLAVIKDADVGASLAELVSPKILAVFKKVAKEYAAMVNEMGQFLPSEVFARDEVNAVQTAIVRHASRILGELDDDDPQSVESTRALLAPIDNLRTRTASKRAASPAPAPTPAPTGDDEATGSRSS